MEQAKINEYRQLAEAHKKERRSAHIILECLAEIERLQKRNGKRAKFQPPTLEGVKAYAKELKLGQDEAEKFFDYHTARAWKSNRTQIVDWKAALRTWDRNVQQFCKSSVTRNGSTEDPKRWIEFCDHKGILKGQHRFAPEYLRLEFSRWLKDAGK